MHLFEVHQRFKGHLLNGLRVSFKNKPQKAPSISPVTSTNVGIIPQNFLTFSFNPFATPV